jgi:hypothetical protein
VNGPVWAQDVAFGTETAYVDCPLGDWGPRGELVRHVDDRAADAAGELDLHRAADRQGHGLEPQVTRDSTGAGTVPSGAIETGLGGAAGPDLLPAAVGGVAVLLLVGLAVVRSRRAAGGR